MPRQVATGVAIWAGDLVLDVPTRVIYIPKAWPGISSSERKSIKKANHARHINAEAD
ncbi:hypothetical protein [uncultured Meiothermus sp.]|jgi:hypothetical protein|uniref:hypothetical protein n=1 Tax=uncultured Meiothermus sp. TaxID=157471 RepID=UPI002610AA48|nr:hypothetical protein [uncultured Meiothermus sp.]